MEDKTVCVIISGSYSDWEMHGFLDSHDEAEKYCAFMNDRGGSEDYYFKEIYNIHCDVSQVKLKYSHEVVFDFVGGMRKEPDRYEYYIGNEKPFDIKYKGHNWIAFIVPAEKREVAERIAQTKYYEILNYAQEMPMKEAIKIVLEKTRRQTNGVQER